MKPHAFAQLEFPLCWGQPLPGNGESRLRREMLVLPDQALINMGEKRVVFVEIVPIRSSSASTVVAARPGESTAASASASKGDRILGMNCITSFPSFLFIQHSFNATRSCLDAHTILSATRSNGAAG